NPINKIEKQLNSYLKNWLDKDLITRKGYLVLPSSDSNLPRIYGLLQIHKGNTPYRIIVFSVNTSLYPIAENDRCLSFLDLLLKVENNKITVDWLKRRSPADIFLFYPIILPLIKLVRFSVSWTEPFFFLILNSIKKILNLL
ncbi:hypothetical protein ALC57_15505, partial [Trachymyrmex cornetzi]